MNRFLNGLEAEPGVSGMNVIDLRSDTVTLPTQEMMDSIQTAELGDDVSGEDPTVNKLEDLAARTFGAEAALLTTSGTQANLVALLVHCRHGDEMLVDSQAHIYYYEVGGMAAVAGVIPRLIEGKKGIFSAQQVEDALRGKDLHFPPSRLLEIENTHNRGGGTVWTPRQVAEVSRVARDHDLKVHIDGARIFNASVALDVPVSDYMRQVDSISFCLSKGLSAPIGSLLVGSNDFIEEARKERKMLGGGMRQAGIVAAPGIVALTKMVDRLKGDHENAWKLAIALHESGKFKLDMSTVQTNIVVADISSLGMDAQAFIQKLKEKGVLASSFGKHLVRFVTHHGISEEDIEETIRRISSFV